MEAGVLMRERRGVELNFHYAPIVAANHAEAEAAEKV